MNLLRYKDIVGLSDIQILMLSDEMRHAWKALDNNLDDAMTADSNLYLLENEIKRRQIRDPVLYPPEPYYRPISYRRQKRKRGMGY